MQIKVNGVTISVENGSVKSQEANVVGSITRGTNLVATAGASSVWTTIINKITSLGTFESVKDMTDSIVSKVKAKVGNDSPSLEEVKSWINSSKGKFVSGAGHWWFNAMEVGDKTSKIPANNLRVIEKDGVVIGLMKMRFVRNTSDLSGLANQQLVLVNGFKGSGSSITPVKIGRCYLKGRDKNLSTAESCFSLISDGENSVFIDGNDL